MPRAFRCALAAVLLLAGCSRSPRPDAAPEIRVANRSPYGFDRVLVRFSSREEDYGALAPGAASAYRRVEAAYRYAYVEVQVDTARFVLQPIDYVAETLLGGGRYTYALSLDPSRRELVLHLEPD